MSEVVNIKSNLRLYQWQRDLIRNLWQHWTGYFHIVKSRRQVGKSVTIETILIKTAIENPCSDSFLLSPSLDQARKIFNEIKDVVINTPIYKRHNDVQLFISFKNGSYIYFKSDGQNEALRGYTVNKGGVLCIDEGAMVSDNCFWTILAWRNVSLAPVVVFSTPKFQQGWFYEYFMRGLSDAPENAKIFSYDWCEYDTSALLPNDVLEMYRKQMPLLQFKNEFLGEFASLQGSVFGDFSDILSDEYEGGLNCFMGIDWGSGQGQDETSISIFNSKRQMMALYHFNDKDESATISFIIGLLKQWKPLKCQVESNSIGQVFYGLLDKAIKAAGIPVMLVRFTTTNESKERLINKLQVAIQNKNVTLLNDATLKMQLSMYEMKVNSNGKKIYNAPAGYHDDCVISTLLALDCISKGTYVISYI